MRKTAHYVITGTIELRSGMRIGGSDDVLQIGGTDLSCIKDPVTGKPYIPGSSLKGKMRSELEKYHGKTGGPDGNEPCGCVREDCPICRLFGPHKKPNHRLGPSRLLVRDGHLLDGGQTELKTEAIIQRQSNTAQHPRTVERVVPGSRFALEIGVQVFDLDDAFEYSNAEQQKVRGHEALLEVVYHALDLVEQTGIGSGISKGYGAVGFDVKNVEQMGRRRGGARPRPATA